MLLDEDDPILAEPKVGGNEARWSPHQTFASSSEGNSAVETAIRNNSDEVGAAGGVGKLLDLALELIGKVPNKRLREIFDLETNPPNTIEGKVVAITPEMDSESHFRAALEVVWQRSAGNWEEMILTLQKELGPIAEKTTKSMREVVLLANELRVDQLKRLIKKYGTPNTKLIPKLTSKDYGGKLLKGDYIAALVDLLREQHGNDYEKVAVVLAKEAKMNTSKGFSDRK